MVLFWFLRSSL